MKNSDARPNRGCFEATVLTNTIVRRCYRRLNLRLDARGSAFFRDVKPGQFAELDLSSLGLPPTGAIDKPLRDAAAKKILLRRPFSFSDVHLAGDSPPAVCVEILYCVLGPSTLRMTTLKPDDVVSVIGPLGNGFSVPRGKRLAVLIAGGMGSPPLQHLAEYLRSNYPDMRVIVFAGAKTLDDFPFIVNVLDGGRCVPDEFARLGDEAYVATDDGSAGAKGLVTDCADAWLAQHAVQAEDAIVYACGPEPMLAAVASLAEKHGLDCQVSMERMMACGIGVCQSCAVETRAAAGETEYRLCCKDGPVFNAKDVCFRK
ncbi:MAG: dihydroorotate dehydrogenase electron transfer subunit [Phycisphaerae bacterium]|nr:dihydroorotate dehydrogenase electron transfer subunit [Phycisphaerae bacterium]